MSKKHKSKASKASRAKSALPKPSAETLETIARQMRRLEKAGWLTFHGFRGSDGHVRVDPSPTLLRMIAVSGLAPELVVAQLLRNMDELDAIKSDLTLEDIEAAAAALNGRDEPPFYV